jgi:hypothetical protein
MATTTKQRMADPRVICTFRSENDAGLIPTPMLIQKLLSSETCSQKQLLRALRTAGIRNAEVNQEAVP